MIRAESITKTFSGVGEPIRSLRDVSVTVERGSIFGLIGSNGSGKSTFLRILSGVYEPDAGDVRIDGVHVFENPAVKSRIVYLSGVLPEHVPAFFNGTVQDPARRVRTVGQTADPHVFQRNAKTGRGDFSAVQHAGLSFLR